jgi:hypothetical protein
VSRAGPLTVAPFLAACVGLTSTDVYLPTYAPMNGYPAGEIQGTLVVEGDCLWIDASQERSLVLWPDGTFVIERDGGRVVREGSREVAIGVPVQLGGGQYGDDNYPFVVDLVGEEIPEPCREAGLYWLGYDLQRVDD